MTEKTHYVDLVSFEGDEGKLLARCVWRGEAPMEITGDPIFVGELSAGIQDEDGTIIMPDAGLPFLFALGYAYRTPYLMATSVTEGEPPV